MQAMAFDEKQFYCMWDHGIKQGTYSDEKIEAAQAQCTPEKIDARAKKAKAVAAAQAKANKPLVEECQKRNGLAKGGVAKVGMTDADVKMCGWGKPSSVNRTTYSFGVHEQWVYSTGNYLYFDKGIVVSIQN